MEDEHIYKRYNKTLLLYHMAYVSNQGNEKKYKKLYDE